MDASLSVLKKILTEIRKIKLQIGKAAVKKMSKDQSLYLLAELFGRTLSLH